MNEKITELLRLIKENPDLPILPMVDGEICAGDDYGYWSGSWGTARVDEFLISKHNDSIHFKSDDDVFDVLERNLTDEEFEKLPETESECRPYFDALPWKKAIIVFIEAENACTGLRSLLVEAACVIANLLEKNGGKIE